MDQNTVLAILFTISLLALIIYLDRLKWHPVMVVAAGVAYFFAVNEMGKFFGY